MHLVLNQIHWGQGISRAKKAEGCSRCEKNTWWIQLLAKIHPQSSAHHRANNKINPQRREISGVVAFRHTLRSHSYLQYRQNMKRRRRIRFSGSAETLGSLTIDTPLFRVGVYSDLQLQVSERTEFTRSWDRNPNKTEQNEKNQTNQPNQTELNRTKSTKPDQPN